MPLTALFPIFQKKSISLKIRYVVPALALLFFSCTGKKESPSHQATLTVAAAANVQFVMEPLKKAFEQKTRIPVQTVLASSGKLTAQISQGAPYDVFVSADTKYPETLFREGNAFHAPKIYAFGALTLWTLREDLDLSLGIKALEQKEIHKIALANPETAPYGEQSIRAMTNAGLLEKLKQAFVFGESIAQTNQYILSKACDIGFTAKSVVLAPGIPQKGKWVEIDPSLYAPIAQAAVITLYGQNKHPRESRLFLEFLLSEDAREIFLRYGYTLP
jgi:molybdate transport system substrate-binding protein